MADPHTSWWLITSRGGSAGGHYCPDTKFYPGQKSNRIIQRPQWPISLPTLSHFRITTAHNGGLDDSSNKDGKHAALASAAFSDKFLRNGSQLRFRPLTSAGAGSQCGLKHIQGRAEIISRPPHPMVRVTLHGEKDRGN